MNIERKKSGEVWDSRSTVKKVGEKPSYFTFANPK